MAWKVHDHQCAACGDFVFEELVKDDETEVPCPNDASHPPCPRVMSSPMLSFVALGNDTERRREALLKRSKDHTDNVLRKEAAERIADKAPFVRQKTSQPKNKVKK